MNSIALGAEDFGIFNIVGGVGFLIFDRII